MVLDYNLISAIVFYVVIFLIIYTHRKKFEIHGKVIALYRTKIGLKLMDRIAKAFPRFLKWLSIVGIYVGYAGMVLITLFLIKGLYSLFTSPNATATISLLIPGVKIPGFIYIPFWYGILSLFFVIVIHEFSHGVISRVFKIPVKSSGVGMFAIFPLAFVEPDEKKMAKKSKKIQLAVFAAGPFSNMISAGLILLVSVFLIVPITNSAFEFKGILIDDLVEGAPAEIAGLESGDILLGIDGTTLNRTNINFLLSDPNPGDEVVFQLEDRNVSINTIAHTDDGLVPYYGIFMKSEIDVKPSVASKFGKFPWLLFYLLEFLNWFFTLSLGIGLANLLPLGPVDGGRMTLVGLTKYFPKERAQRVWKQISFFILLILLLNLAFPFLKKLIHPVL